VGASTGRTLPLPPFLQVFILKVLRTLCFEAFLEVFIPKGVTGADFASVAKAEFSGRKREIGARKGRSA
jgi:hypothetical protein